MIYLRKKTQPAYLYGLLLVILAAVTWGIGGGIAGLLIDRDWSPPTIAGFRALVGLIFMIALLLILKKVSFKFNKLLIFWSITAGIGLAGNMGFYFLSISETNVPVAATLMYTAPIFVIIISILFRIEIITFFKALSSAIVVFGIMLLTGVFEMSTVDINMLGVVSGLLSALSYALFIFSFKFSVAHGHPLIVLSIAAFTETTIHFLFADKRQIGEFILTFQDLSLALLIGFTGAGLATFIYMIGLKKVTAGTASMVSMVEPVAASMFGIILLGQLITNIQLLGMVIILLTVTSLSIYDVREKSRKTL